MRTTSILFTLVLSAAGTAYAQAGSSYPLYIKPPASRGCPVSLSATREPGGPLHSVLDGVILLGQQLRINFSGAPRAIIQTDVVAHGVKTTGGEGMVLTGPSRASRDASETFQLSGTTEAPLLHPLIATSGMTAISWIEVTRLKYADGTEWKPSTKARCVAAPSLMVLVASAQ